MWFILYRLVKMCIRDRRNELTQKYLAELKVSTNEYDLEIVNLQLDLYAYDARVYICLLYTSRCV